MLWKVKVKDKILSLTSPEVLELIYSKMLTKTQKPDHDALIMQMINYLNSKVGIYSFSILQIAHMAFSLGYYYKVFLSKNEIEIIDESSNKQQSNTDSTS